MNASANAIAERCKNTIFSIYREFIDEIKSQSKSKPVKEIPTLTIKVTKANIIHQNSESSRPIRVLIKLMVSEDGGDELQEDVKMTRMKATHFGAARSDKYWVDPNQIYLETK